MCRRYKHKVIVEAAHTAPGESPRVEFVAVQGRLVLRSRHDVVGSLVAIVPFAVMLR